MYNHGYYGDAGGSGHHHQPVASTSQHYINPSPYYSHPPPQPPPPAQYHHHQQYPPYQHQHPAPPQQPSPFFDRRLSEDPNAFRYYLNEQLAGLTFNSKDIITNLTIVANENSIKMAHIVSQCLEQHIRNTAPPYKLYALYLLDSICKNIGPPYISLFSRFIERLFLEVYRDVDPPTKVKLEELLGTWKTGAPDGTELFPGGRVQRGIETALFGRDGKGGGIGGGGRGRDESQFFMSGVQQLPGPASPAERANVLFDIRRKLDKFVAYNAAHPYDEVTRSQETNLRQLEALVQNTQLNSDQIVQIRSQVSILAPPPDPTPQPPIVPTSASFDPAAIDVEQLASLLTPEVLQAAAVASGSSLGAQNTSNPLTNEAINSAVQGAVFEGPASGAADMGNTDNLFNGLMSAGLVDMNGVAAALKNLNAAGVVGGVATPTGQQQMAGGDDAQLREDDETVETYRQAILYIDIKLTNADIQKFRDVGPPLLYELIKLQCKTCGARFLESRTGQKRLAAHNEAHVRQRRMIKEAAGRNPTRTWFDAEEDWIVPPVESDVPAKSTAAASIAAAKEERARLMKSKVVVPPDHSGEKICPIDQEALKSEWVEEDEEWVWMNAVKVDGVVYHATCYHDGLTSQAVNRLKERSSVSREGTPVPNTPSGAGPSPLKQVSGIVPKKEEDEADAGGGMHAEEGVRIKSEPDVDSDMNGTAATLPPIGDSSKKRKAEDDGEGGAGVDGENVTLEGDDVDGAPVTVKIEGERVAKRLRSSEPEAS